ncbi:FtsB family cell division protein [Enterococcus timonensis]|uniref:FtsB family cell division protein n=1 Tax=Enterococcus timonensis TaxID=1852364 RepID=UPI0008DAACF1|nr:septum formation initiator family protein [Enterococcus timonensis]
MNNQPNNKIAPLKNEFHKEQLVKLHQVQREIIFKRRRLTVIFVLAIILVATFGAKLIADGQKLQSLRQQETAMISQEEQLAQQEQDLKDDVALLHDEEYVAKLARSRYLLSKDGEQVYTIPNEQSSSTTENK